MKNSNVAIDPITNEHLTEFCTRAKLTKKDFISTSLKYFNDYSINPAKHEKPTQEIEKMHKRIEDIFKFSKAQERDLLKPFLVDVAKKSIETKEEISNLRKTLNSFTAVQIKQEKEKTDQLNKMHQEQINLILAQNKKQAETINQFRDIIMILGETLEAKNKGIFDSFKNSLK